MPTETTTQIEELAQTTDKDGQNAHVASDERLESVRQNLANQPGLSVFKHTTAGTGAEQLPSNAVPDGVEVSVIYYPSNGGTVWVGDADTQEVPLTGVGQSLTVAVEDTDALWIQTPTAGDAVTVVFES